MREFMFERFVRATDAASAVAARPDAMFLAGGTTLVDLMKIDVLTPDTVVEVRNLGLSRIDVSDDAITVGATVTNSQLAWHPIVREPDAMTPLGTKGIGELAITGMAAAIANAVYHASGTRVRSLPISIEKVLREELTQRHR